MAVDRRGMDRAAAAVGAMLDQDWARLVDEYDELPTADRGALIEALLGGDKDFRRGPKWVRRAAQKLALVALVESAHRWRARQDEREKERRSC